MDTIVELDSQGNTLWTWDTYAGGHFSLKDECLCNATTVVNGQTVIDLTHEQPSVEFPDEYYLHEYASSRHVL